MFDNRRHYARGNGAQLVNNPSGFVEAPHMHVRRSQKAVWGRVVGVLLDSEEELRYCLIEASAEEMRGADDIESGSEASTRAETERGLHMLDG